MKLLDHNITQSWIALTSVCNNRCKYCYYGHSLTDEIHHMPLSMAKDVIDLLDSINVEDCALVGGEPTLYPELYQLVNYGNSRKMKIGLVTNGNIFAVMENCKKIIDSGIHRISISLEGTSSAIHDSITQRKGSFNSSMKAITNFLDLNFPIDTIMTICNSNIEDVKKMIDLLCDLGFEYAVFNICTPSVSQAGENKEIVDLHQMGKLISQISEYRVSDIKISIVTPYPKCLLEDNYDTIRLGVCQMYHGDGLTIDVDGSALPCTHFSGAPLFNILKNGEVMTKTEFTNLWLLKTLDFQNNLWHYPSKDCSICDYWKNCYGGCPLFWTICKPEDYTKALSYAEK